MLESTEKGGVRNSIHNSVGSRWGIRLLHTDTPSVKNCIFYMGWVVKIDDIAAKLVKSRLPAAFEGDFQSSQKSNFIDNIAFLESKNDFDAVRW